MRDDDCPRVCMSVTDFADFVGLTSRAVRSAIQSGRISGAFWNNGVRLVDVEHALVDMNKKDKLDHYRSKVRDIINSMDSEEISSKHIVVRSLRTERSIEAPSRYGDPLANEIRELRVRKLNAESAIANLNLKRATGELIDYEKAEPIVVEAFSSFNGLLDQLAHKIAYQVPGCRSQEELEEVIRKQMETTSLQVLKIVETAKSQVQKAVEQQRRPLRH